MLSIPLLGDGQQSATDGELQPNKEQLIKNPPVLPGKQEAEAMLSVLRT